MTTLFRLLLVFFSVSSGAFSAAADDDTFVPAEGVAIAGTEELARRDAYYQAFDTTLRKVMGDAAATCIGVRFRQELKRGLSSFRRRYFSPDTIARCRPDQGSSNTYCEVDGQVDFSALRQAVKQYLAEVPGLRQFKFVTAVEPGLSREQQRVYDRLNGEFAYYNYRVFVGRDVERLARANQADFALAVYEITFSEFVYNPDLRQLSGTLTVNFRLNDLNSREVRVFEPVTVDSAVPGLDRRTLEDPLVQSLAVKAARAIARSTNEEVGECAVGLVEWELHIAGADVSARTTRQLRLQLTGLLEEEGFSDIETDYEKSGQSVTVLKFLGRDDISPDKVVDALYDALGSDPSFYATYRGNRIFEIGYRP